MGQNQMKIQNNIEDVTGEPLLTHNDVGGESWVPYLRGVNICVARFGFWGKGCYIIAIMKKDNRDMKNFKLVTTVLGAAVGAILLMGGNNMGLFLILIAFIANLNTH